MREGCRVALSGTPGTGKTTISRLLHSEGFDVLSMEKIAEKHNCLGELDSSDNSKPIDVELLISILRNTWDIMPENITIIAVSYTHLTLPTTRRV